MNAAAQVTRVGIRSLKNGYIPSFDGRLHDQLINGEIFYTLAEARVIEESKRSLLHCLRPIRFGCLKAMNFLFDLECRLERCWCKAIVDVGRIDILAVDDPDGGAGMGNCQRAFNGTNGLIDGQFTLQHR